MIISKNQICLISSNQSEIKYDDENNKAPYSLSKNIQNDDFKNRKIDSNSCDPVLTQIALNTNNAISETQCKANLNPINMGIFSLNKRNLFNQNNNEDSYLPSIDVSNLNVQSNLEMQDNPTLNFSSQSLNFLNQTCEANNRQSVEKPTNTDLSSQTLSTPLNIFKFNSATNNMTEGMNSSYGPYSMSLPSHY